MKHGAILPYPAEVLEVGPTAIRVRPEEVAPVAASVAFLDSHAPIYANSSVLIVDGRYTAA